MGKRVLEGGINGLYQRADLALPILKLAVLQSAMSPLFLDHRKSFDIENIY